LETLVLDEIQKNEQIQKIPEDQALGTPGYRDQAKVQSAKETEEGYLVR